VKVTNALVTATNGSTAWVMIRSGDPGFTSTNYSGLKLNLSSFSGTPPQVGNRIEVEGTVPVPAPSTGPVLEVTSLAVTQQNDTVTPVSAGVAEFESHSAPIDGLLVTMNTTLKLESNNTSTWSMSASPSGSLTIGNRIIGTLPSFVTGTYFSPTIGIADTLDSGYLLPRVGEDLHET
jgi:hypothetical protein